MLLFPISILAQKSVLFDFTKYSESEKVPSRIEREGIVLEFSTRSKKLYSPKCSVINGCPCVRLVSDSLLTIKGVSCEITSVVFSIVDDKKRLRVYDDDDKMSISKEKKGRKEFYRQEWEGNKQSISFTPTTAKGSFITSINVTYKPVRPMNLLRTQSLSTSLQPSELLFIMVRSRLLFLKESLHERIRLLIMFFQ